MPDAPLPADLQILADATSAATTAFEDYLKERGLGFAGDGYLDCLFVFDVPGLDNPIVAQWRFTHGRALSEDDVPTKTDSLRLLRLAIAGIVGATHTARYDRSSEGP